MKQQNISADKAAGNPKINPLYRFAALCWLGVKSRTLRKRINRPVLERIADHYFLVVPEVMNPVVFRSGKYFAEAMAGMKLSGVFTPDRRARALDMGTGSGICAIILAGLGYKVTGVDINPHAVRCAKANVLLNRMEAHIEIRHGDLFAPVRDEQFDLILFNPPFYLGKPVSEFDLAWRSADVFERFATGLAASMTDNGQAFILLSTDGEPFRMLDALYNNNLGYRIVGQRDFGNEIMTIYRILKGSGD